MPVGQLAPAGRFRESSRKGQGIEGLPRGQLAPVIQRAAPHGLELAAPRRQRRAERAVHPKLLGRDLLLAEDRRLRVALAARSDLSTSGRSVRRREVSAGVRSAGVGPVAGVLSLDLVSTSARSRLDLAPAAAAAPPACPHRRASRCRCRAAAGAGRGRTRTGTWRGRGPSCRSRAPCAGTAAGQTKRQATPAGRDMGGSRAAVTRRGWRARAVDVPWRSRSRAMRGETDGASTWTPQCIHMEALGSVSGATRLRLALVREDAGEARVVV